MAWRQKITNKKQASWPNKVNMMTALVILAKLEFCLFMPTYLVNRRIATFPTKYAGSEFPNVKSSKVVSVKKLEISEQVD